jgi:acyl-CoA synthetase (AMP-forming)/AMP-acid ligase II
MNLDVHSFRNRRNDQRWNRMAVGDIIERITWSTPDKPCLIAADDAVVNPAHARVSYAQANALMNRIANAMIALGLPEAARVAMLAENSVEAWLTKVAASRAGLVSAPVNVMMAPDVIADCLTRVGAEVIVADAAQWEKHGEQLAASGIRPILLFGGPDGGDIPSFDDFIAGHDDTEPDVTIHGDDVWEILFTSGTTAAPKAAMISHSYTYNAAFAQTLSMVRHLNHESELISGAFTPMTFHIGDQLIMFGPLMAGGTVVLGRKPDGPSIARACTREKITFLFGGSPQFLESVIRTCQAAPDDYDLSSLTAMNFGWAPLDPKSLQAFRDLTRQDLAVWEVIGQTECVPCHVFHIDQNRELYEATAPAQNYVGLPVPMLAAKVVDEDGEDLKDRPGEQGEAVYRSPAMFSGYYGDEDATREAIKNGWFHSGDSFTYDENRFRIMVDRYKDIVKSGGENVSSIRVEAVLQQHPAVARAAVIGVPDDKWGELVTACVIAEEGHEIDEEELIRFARGKLAGFETPKRIVVVDGFPETVGGKILKYKLRTQLNEAASEAAE